MRELILSHNFSGNGCFVAASADLYFPIICDMIRSDDWGLRTAAAYLKIASRKVEFFVNFL